MRCEANKGFNLKGHDFPVYEEGCSQLCPAQESGFGGPQCRGCEEVLFEVSIIICIHMNPFY